MKRVLFVDDDKAMRIVIGAQLQSLGVSSIGAEGVEEALQILATTSDIGLVMMDCAMPITDGYTGSSMIKHLYPLIPVIAVTASDFPGNRQQCLDAGMCDYACKPLLISGLGTMLNKWIPGIAKADQ